MSNYKPLVVIFQGSKSDVPHSQQIADECARFGVEAQMRICSAHKAPHRLLELIARYEANPRPKVYITVAGRSNALSGMADANVTAPVIACPPYSSSFGGNDIFSSIRMPGGVVPMLVLDTKNAAMAAVKILALSDPSLKAAVVRSEQLTNAAKLHVDDCEIKSKAYLPRISEAIASGREFSTTDLKLSPKNGAKEVSKYTGKVRDRYNDGKNVVLVTTDRLTGFDRPLANIPFKGQVLNQVSLWWFEQTKHIIPNHVMSAPHPNVTLGRACKPFDIEFVVRGYITGSSATSMWTHYDNGVRDYCGIRLPDGLKKNEKLWTNLVTPTTKSDEHDELITPEEIVKAGWMTQEEWDYCSSKALELFNYGQKRALEHGLILVDTKYEMGRDLETGEILLIDEIHTPDSSRYWIASTYDKCMAEGKSPQNIDKEFVRLWFRENCDPYNDKELPEAPADLRAELSRRYVMLFELLTGDDFDFGAVHEEGDANAAVQASLDVLKV